MELNNNLKFFLYNESKKLSTIWKSIYWIEEGINYPISITDTIWIILLIQLLEVVAHGRRLQMLVL